MGKSYVDVASFLASKETFSGIKTVSVGVFSYERAPKSSIGDVQTRDGKQFNVKLEAKK